MIPLLKAVVLNWRFVQSEIQRQRLRAVEEDRPKTFKLAQKDILDTLEDDTNEAAQKIADERLSTMLSPIQWQHVISLNERQGTIFLGNERADDARLANLKSEAELIESTELWKILVETPNSLAQQAMFEKGDDLDTFKKGRSLIFFIDTQKKIVETLRALTPKSYQQKA